MITPQIPSLWRRIASRFAGLVSVAAFAAFPAVATAATFNVSTPSQFTSALASVQPGDTIVLSGTITSSSKFSTTRAGTAAAPITIQGDGTAVLSGSSTYGLEILHDYYRLNNFRIQNVGKGIVIDNADHGAVENVHIMDVKQEAFKVRNQSQYWVFAFCSARRTGGDAKYGEGFYVGQASSNWIGSTPDRSGYVTFFNCYTTDTFNDGWDLKEGAHHIKIVNCTADFSGATEPTSDSTYGSAGYYLRCDNVQILKSSVVNLNNGDWGYRMSNQTVGGVDYGSSGNEIKQSSVISGNVGFIFSESLTNGKVYTDCINGPGGFYASGSAVVAQPSSGFSEMTWSGEGGGIYGSLDPDVGTNDPLGTPPPPQVSAPTFNPAGGTYTSAQSVTISTTTSGASIRYTTNGTAPTATTGTVYSGPVAISATTTLQAIAYKSGMTNSAVTSATYTISAIAQVAAPTFNPAGGTYTSATSVTITSATSGASIRYTTDGSTPTASTGTVYSGPVAISVTTTLKAIAYKSGMTDSAVTSATYTISIPSQVAAPAFNPASGTYTSAQSITISTATSGASIRYTSDGSTPTSTTGTLYSGPVTLSVTTTLKAIAYLSGMTNSAVTTAVYTITTGGGSSSQDITILSTNDDAKQRASNTVVTNSWRHELGYDGTEQLEIGLRFPGLNIPRNATVTAAYIQFEADKSNTGASSLTLKAELSTNAAAFTTATSNITNRPVTSASVGWSPPSWVQAERGAGQKTPDLKTLVQAVVNQSTWNSGNAIAFVISGTGTRTAEASESGADKAPLLHIEWQ